MEEAVDGDYQAYKSRNGAFVREKFFGAYPELAERVEHMTDDEIWLLNRGGHDPHKVYAAYAAAIEHTGQPTVILAKTVKGYGMGEAGEGQNITHQQKKMTEKALFAFRDRFELPLSDDEVRATALHKPPEASPELTFLRERREALGGSLPARRASAPPLEVPPLTAFQSQLDGTADREISTTMAFVRVLAALVRDKQFGPHVVPIVPDESRTFGMEGMFRQLGIFSQVGQLYQPEDREQLMFYREDKKGQILQEGINEPGAFSSWIAAATSYANHGVAMVPFYIFYSMFGFQRVGDLAWAAGASRGRGGGHPARDARHPRGRRRAHPAARLGNDPARGPRGGRPARRGLRRTGRRVERDELHRAAPRRDAGRALERAAPARDAAAGLRRRAARRPAHRRRDRLHPCGARPDPALRPRALPRARHRRLRAQRLAPGAAALLRGRPPPRRGRGAERARRGREGGRGDRQV